MAIKFKHEDTNIVKDIFGNPLPGSQVFFYEAQTSNNIDIFADVALSVPLTNPLTTDSFGRLPSVFVADGVAFDAHVYTNDGTRNQIVSTEACTYGCITRSAGGELRFNFVTGDERLLTEDDLSALNAGTTANATAIAANTTAIAANETAIAANETAIAANETAIAAQAAQAATVSSTGDLVISGRFISGGAGVVFDVGAVGSLIFAEAQAPIVYGNVYAGSGLRPAGVFSIGTLPDNTREDGNATGLIVGDSGVLSGSYRALGSAGSHIGATSGATLFQRIA